MRGNRTGRGTFIEYPENINRNGRPKGSSWKKKIMELVEQKKIECEYVDSKGNAKKFTLDLHGKTLQEAIILVMAMRALKGDSKATEWLSDRMEGKPTQSVDLGGEVKMNMFDLSKLSDDEIKSFKKMLERVSVKNPDIHHDDSVHH